MPKLSDPGELEIVKQVYGFAGRRPSEKSEEVDRAEKRYKKEINQAR